MWALRGVSSAGLERLPVTQKVEGSSPLHPATFILRLVAVFFIAQIVDNLVFTYKITNANQKGINDGCNTILG